ncbi:hypothetical protein [Streptomyces atroolivaceus]|uniref:hypothetical protein n=1 Tax=Streptomyces atroolivaceus TaxID=66869 RepID=UPI0036C83877
MNGAERLRVPLLVVVSAVLFTGCAGAGSEPAPPGATQTVRPDPAPSAPTPSTPAPSPTPSPTPSTAAEIAEGVTHWYEYGGETAMVSLINEAAEVRAGRPDEPLDLVTLDFGDLMNALDTARMLGSVPDPETRTAWSLAVEQLDAGARELLGSAPENSLFQSPEQAGQAWRGWHTFDEGIKSLKAAEARLRDAFGLKPPSDPWAER